VQGLAGAAVTLSDCAFEGNIAGSGGAVSIAQGTLRVERCTFVGNEAIAGSTGAGGAIHNDGSQVDIVNSTFSDNGAGAGSGAAVATLSGGATTRIHSSSFVGNTTTTGGGTISRHPSGTVILTHTLIAEAAAGQNCGEQPPTSEGFNLSDDDSCGFAGVGDLDDAVDAGIGPLADNGGPTDTHALLLASVAVDAGDLDCFDTDGTTLLTTDQRGTGFPRRKDGNGDAVFRCDIGAIEVPEPGAGAGAAATLALAALARRRRSRLP
jgi:hypothetical protein